LKPSGFLTAAAAAAVALVNQLQADKLSMVLDCCVVTLVLHAHSTTDNHLSAGSKSKAAAAAASTFR
jgi:hypothetical protein